MIIISVSEVSLVALKMIATAITAGLLTMVADAYFCKGGVGAFSRVTFITVFSTLAMIISWLMYGHPGVEFVA